MSPKNIAGMTNNGWLCFQLLLLLACSRGGSSVGSSASDPIRGDQLHWQTYPWQCNDGRVIGASEYPVMVSCYHIAPGSCVDTTKVIGNCNTDPPELGNHENKRMFQNANDDDIAVFYWCKHDERMSTGERGIFTYCIDGAWTPIDDDCLPGSSLSGNSLDNKPIRDNLYEWKYSWHCKDGNDGRVIDTSGYPVMLGCSHIVPISCVDTTKIIGNCDTNPPQLDNHDKKKEFQNANDDDIAVHYWCKFDERMSTGERGIFTYCIDGEWTPIDDECFPECNEGRECSELNEDSSNNYEICPMKYGDPVKTYCYMEKRLTLVLRIERGSDTLDFTKAAAQDPQGNTGSNFFIGLKNLIGIHWQDNNSIPHDLVIYGKIGSSQTKEWTTYNNFLLNRTGFVVSLGSNMGALGDVVRDIEGKEFCPGDGEECWWGKYNDLLGYSTAGDNQDDFVEVWVRPHTGKIVLCPHNFVRSRDGKSCLTLVATKGDLVNNTQECAKRYSSLAFITHFDDVKRLKNDSLILTGYYVKEKNDPYDYIPALPDANVITSDTNVTRSHMSNLDLCVAMKHSDMNHWYLTYCHKDNMNAICMVPVTCPENYEIVGVLCYKLIASSSPEPTFLDALATCNTEGSGLAHPTNISQLNKLAEFIANNVDWSAHDVADVAIGLNVAFGNASLGGMYEISDEVHNAVNGSSVEGTQHLFLSVTQNASWVLKPADFNDFTSFYVCEFHGPLGCWTFPPHSKNMSTERTFTNRTVHESVTYSCNRGFFVNAEVGNKTTQHRQCHGQLGGWAPLEPLIPCIGVVVCNESLPSHPHMTIENSKYPGYETYWMKYICYPGMGTADGKVKQKFTCTEYNGTYDYDGTEVEECNRCLTPPDEDVPNSKPTNSSGPWMVNSMVTVTCEDNYLVDRNMIDQQVLCTLKGWDSRDCHKVCLGEPLVGNATTTWRDDMWLVNDTINATCLEGYHFIEANTTEMLLSCEYDGWEDLLACEKVCQDDLEVGNATTEKSGSVWLVGRINTVTCFSEHRFLSINDATKEVECQFEGWEETEGCLKVCEDEPTVSSASSDWTSAEPWPEGSSVEVTCDTGLYQYPSLETQQTLECTYEGWTSATICEQVCFEAPDLTEYKALWNDSIPPGRLHDEISINCRSSHYHNESLDNTTIPAVCTPDGWQATYPCILSCKEPPDFGTVIMEWLETEPGRFGDEVIMECPNKHRNSEDISLTTITVGCTAEGWKTLTTCMKCCEEAPDAANLNIMWPSGLVDIILSKVTVDCLDDYYSEENLVSNTTVAQCTGDGWLVLKPCVRVCAETPQFGDVPIDWGTRGRGKVSQEVSLDCPEGYRNNDSLPSSTTTVSCTLHGWVNLDECVKACVEDPDAASMNINWEPLLATLGTEVEVDCLEEHYSNETLTTTITTVQCVEEGWWVTYPCVRVCTEKPDFGNVSVEWEERGPGRMGDNITLDCPAGYRSTDHLHLNTTLVTCTDHGWENVDPCVNVCLEEDLGGVAIEEEELGQWRVDEVVARACPEDFLTFKEAVNVTDFICTAEGWTNPDPCVNVCRERLYPVNGEANWNQRIWTAGHKLLVICLSQHHVSSDVYSYTVPCTDSGWYNVNSSCTYYPPPTDGIPVIDPDDVLAERLKYSQTTIYHWPTASNNMTVSDEGENKFRYVEGPTAFGNALEFISDSNQCLVHKDFTIASDKCTANLTNCEEGLSMSVWYKGYQGIERDWDNVSQDPNDPSVTETIASTGGDTEGHPGIAVYLQGMTLKAVVSTGDEYWLASCVGMLKNDKWTNIAFSWKHDEGLLLYIDTKLEASTMYPVPNSGAKPALTPPLMHLGCHSDATNTDYRHFLDGAVDELAIWDKALRGTDAALFLGDHIRAFAEVSVEDLSSIVDEADISDPDVMAAALLITAQSTYSEEVPEGALTASTTAATTTTTTTNSDASTTDSGSGSTTTTMQPESDAYKKFKSVMKLFKKFSGTTLKDVDITRLDKTLALVDVTSNIFVQKHKEFLTGANVGKDADGETPMVVNANQIMEDLANWTMRVMQNTDFGNRTEMFSLVKETENLIVYVFKGPQSALHTTKNGFVVAPNCEIMSEKPSWNNTCNRAAVPSAVVTNPKCENRITNVVITSSRNVHKFSQTWAVGGAMDSYLPHELNSMVLSVKMTPDPVLDKEGKVDKRAPHCKPDPKDLHQTPLRLKLFDLMTHLHQSRKLSFHEEAPVKRVLSQHCAWWDADMRQWDGTDCVVMENTDSYTKCACARFGSFVVLNELIEPRVVPDEHLWLLVLRYVGYTLSILLIIIYIIVVAVSRDLKDQFHLMGLNLAVAVLVGAVAMVVSDLEAVRDDRHWCTVIGTIIQLFYQAAGAWILLLGHAAFNAITSGVIGGRLKCYLPISWGLPFISVGLNYLLFMLDLGEDPRCFISWENPPKFVFFGFQLLFVAVACFCACVVLCNMATTALRKDNLIDDYGSFCNGAAFLMLFFSTTWIFGFFCYIRLSRSSLDFYPIFQVLNSWTGVVLFLFIGLASRRFRMVVAGQAKLRRDMLKGYAFGKTGEAKGNPPPPGGGGGAGAGPSTFFNPLKKTTKPKNNQGTKGKLPPVKKKNAPGRAPLRTFTAD